ncbi:hypothetical protein [Allosalinactinospora lopnorensis]|uniref:hypothetical protein n=1 Tax=Allosalinactinospora lopnorensis TaxID=1352348 RepID=UPI000623FC58|nr:hypothetical protein [Allosalinactinospora lopnorensis]
MITPSEERITELVATDINTGKSRHIKVAEKEDSEETDPGQGPYPSESPGVPGESPVYPDGEPHEHPDGEEEHGVEEDEQPDQDTVPEQEPAPESDG